MERADHFHPGMKIEVEGRPMEILAGRRVNCSGGDWLPATLDSIEIRENGGKYAHVLHHDIYEDEAGTKPLLETISVRFIRPAQPDEGKKDMAFHPKEGDIVDARLPDIEGESGIWWVATVVDVNELRGYQVARPETGEKYWVHKDKLRPTRTWLSGDTWISSTATSTPSISRGYSDAHSTLLTEEKEDVVMIKDKEYMYIGDYVKGQKSGWGVELRDDHTLYVGRFHNNLRHGIGITIIGQNSGKNLEDKSIPKLSSFLQMAKNTSDFDIYYGQSCEGLYAGYGVYEYAIGDRCAGRFRDGRLLGPSVYKWAKAGYFAGNWSESQTLKPIQAVKSGLGVRKGQEGVYEGNWSEDNPHGVGIMKFPNKDRYEGTWSNGMITGCGMLFKADGVVYTGEFLKGIRHGYGVLVSGPVCYEGSWKKGKRHGYGQETCQEGGTKIIQQSFWNDDKLVRIEVDNPDLVNQSVQEAQAKAQLGREAAERAVESCELSSQWVKQAEKAAEMAEAYHKRSFLMRSRVLQTLCRTDMEMIQMPSENSEELRLFYIDNFISLVKNVISPEDGSKGFILELKDTLTRLFDQYNVSEDDDALTETAKKLELNLVFALDGSIERNSIASTRRITIIQQCLRLLFKINSMIPENELNGDIEHSWKSTWDMVVKRLESIRHVSDIDFNALSKSDPVIIEGYIQELMDSLSSYENYFEKIMSSPPSREGESNPEINELRFFFKRCKEIVNSEYEETKTCLADSKEQERNLFQQMQEISTGCASLFSDDSMTSPTNTSSKKNNLSTSPLDCLSPESQQRDLTFNSFSKHCDTLQELRAKTEEIIKTREIYAKNKRIVKFSLHVIDELSYFSEICFKKLEQIFSNGLIQEPILPIANIQQLIQCEKHVLNVWYETLKLFAVQARGKTEELNSFRKLQALGGLVEKEDIYKLELGIETIKNKWNNTKLRVAEGYKNINWTINLLKRVHTIKEMKSSGNEIITLETQLHQLLETHTSFAILCEEWDQIFPASKQKTSIKTETSTRSKNKKNVNKDFELPTYVITHPDCINHVQAPGGYERPERLLSIMEGIRSIANEQYNFRILDEIPKIGEKQILAVHSESYLRKIIQKTQNIDSFSSKTPLSGICGDTYLGRDSLNAAYFAASGVCAAVDRVVRKECYNAFVAIRPPGHHAGINGNEQAALEQNLGQGYCVMNNVAIGVRHAQEQHENIRKVAIIDIDAHHGNGTEEIFAKDDTVLFASIHQAFVKSNGTNEYPGTGMNLQTDGLTINIPMHPKKDQKKDYFEMFDKFIVPAVNNFKPDLLMVSAGFDAHEDDIIGHLWLSYYDYTKLTKKIMQLAEDNCAGRLVSVLEGGYNLNVLKRICKQHVITLSDRSENDKRKTQKEEYDLNDMKPDDENEIPSRRTRSSSIDNTSKILRKKALLRRQDVIHQEVDNVDKISSSKRQKVVNNSL